MVTYKCNKLVCLLSFAFVVSICALIFELIALNLTYMQNKTADEIFNNYFIGNIDNNDHKYVKWKYLLTWPDGLFEKSDENEKVNYTGLESLFGLTKLKQYPLNVTNRVSECRCAKLFAGDQVELEFASKIRKERLSERDQSINILKRAQNCGSFMTEGRYVTSPISDEEASFPIAYSIIAYKDVEQLERLIRAIYRPQNIYCIHIDKKSPLHFIQAVVAIAQCFINIFIASRSTNVEWGSFSLLEADLICMEDLFKNKNWKYFINLTGQEFPLKTNLDIVRILKTYNGANDVEGTIDRRNFERLAYVHHGFSQTTKAKEPPPVNVTLTKGAVHIVAQRGFVDFILHHPDALKFRDWVKDTGVPDETFFSSLNHSPQLGVPGSYLGVPETHPINKPFLARFKNWGVYPFNWPCHGKRVRMICIFGIGDLPVLRNQRHLFANKFYYEYEPLAYDCMEELHYNRTQHDIAGSRNFDVSYYRQLSFVKHHVT